MPATAASDPKPTESARRSAPARRRTHGPCQDQALYTCHCGYVFQAPVLTTVDCPHCGHSQAW